MFESHECLHYSSKMTWKTYLTWVVILVVSGKVAKLELRRLPIRHNGGKGKFVTLVVSRIRHFTYATKHQHTEREEEKEKEKWEFFGHVSCPPPSYSLSVSFSLFVFLLSFFLSFSLPFSSFFFFVSHFNLHSLTHSIFLCFITCQIITLSLLISPTLLF